MMQWSNQAYFNAPNTIITMLRVDYVKFLVCLFECLMLDIQILGRDGSRVNGYPGLSPETSICGRIYTI